ncbi:hypothetical protein AUR64_14110 [Haloprofundus marisrubri]|uniref:DUF8056 domain-containing protein n=1 Tax=Haloprofundus marisrubri TaxID=1514971 RepID=A0A0W1R6V6_9EURY|nr:hypothetical protein [Haloprofundus marisrubri]KTG08940.1 hypothetical protein AUR64_14110 [Haloprofundus marisrubri]
MADGYNGVFGAFPYALRHSTSWLFRLYVAVSALVALFLSLIVGMGLVVLIAGTVDLGGGQLTLSRSFYAVVGLLLVAPVLAPTLFVARRHRREETRENEHYDFALGLSGFVFLASLYVGAIITVPPDLQTPVSGSLAPLVEFLYGLPQLFGLVPPLLAALLIFGLHRRLR